MYYVEKQCWLLSVERLKYTQSTRVSVSSLEFGPPTSFPPIASVSPPLDPGGGGQNSLVVEGVGDPVRTTVQKAGHSVYSVVLSVKICYFIQATRVQNPTLEKVCKNYLFSALSCTVRKISMSTICYLRSI